MKNIGVNTCCLSAILFCLAGLANAQKEKINRVEFFGGYSHIRAVSPYTSDDLRFVDTLIGGNGIEQNLGKSYGLKGANFSITGNFSKYVGVKFDFSTHSNDRSFRAGTSNLQQKYRLTNFLGGIQVKNNKSDGPRVKPFFNALLGGARQKIKLSGLTGPLATFFEGNAFEQSQTNFALAIGGGIDIRAGKHVDIRVFQVDFNPTFIKETDDFDGKYQGNVRFGFGIVFH